MKTLKYVTTRDMRAAVRAFQVGGHECLGTGEYTVVKRNWRPFGYTRCCYLWR
jgi:hypothetical protein